MLVQTLGQRSAGVAFLTQEMLCFAKPLSPARRGGRHSKTVAFNVCSWLRPLRRIAVQRRVCSLRDAR